MTKFYIIEFNDGVQLVPESWLTKNKKSCRFPNGYDSFKLNKALRNEESPLSSWPLYPVIKVLGKADLDNYEEGQKKVKRSLRSPDLDESTDLEQRRSKKRAAELNEPLYDFPVTPSIRCVVQPETSTPSTSEKDKNDEVTQKLAYLQMQLDLLMDNQQRILENQKLILENQRLILEGDKKEENEGEKFEIQFPLETIEELFDIEKKLREQSFRNKLILRLKKLGGRNLTSIIGCLLQHTMSPTLAVGFSYYGTKEKLQFSTLGMCEIISEVARYHEKDATSHNIKEIIQNWLRHAKERLHKPKKHFTYPGMSI